MRSSAHWNRLGVVLGVVLGVGLGAAAADRRHPRSTPPARVTWADWVGDHDGRLSWRRCGSPGAARARLAIEAVDGVVSIDLTPAGGGLRAMTLVEDDAAPAWTARQGDVTVRVTRPRMNAIDLVVTIDAGCTVTGRLVRAASPVAACDRLVGWARIDAACTRHDGSPSEDLAALGRERLGWRATTPGLAARCTARATRIATTMADVGCAPIEDLAASRIGPACQRLLSATAHLRRCPAASPAVAAVVEQFTAMPMSAADDTSRGVVEATCRDRHAQILELARRVRCPM